MTEEKEVFFRNSWNLIFFINSKNIIFFLMVEYLLILKIMQLFRFIRCLKEKKSLRFFLDNKVAFSHDFSYLAILKL